MDGTLRVGLGAVRRRINNLPPFQDGTFLGCEHVQEIGWQSVQKIHQQLFFPD